MIDSEFRLEDGLTFDDVLIKPKYSEIMSRSEVDLSVSFPKGFKFDTPLTPSNMKTVCGQKMVQKMYEIRGLGLLHRFMEFDEKVSIIKSLSENKDWSSYIGVSIGVQDRDYVEVDKFIDMGTRIICIDVAHFASKIAVKIANHIASKYPNILLIAGSVATGDGAEVAWENGVDAVRVGIGNGSICLTRIETGVGVPQLSALMDVYERQQHRKRDGQPVGMIISDGGCSKPADVAKALLFSDMVMAGNIFAGSDETPGEIVEKDGSLYKRYDGSSTHKTHRVEGVKSLVPYKGSVTNIFRRFHEGIQSACSYQGVNNLVSYKVAPQLIKMTNNGLRESGAHNVMVLT